MIISNSKGKWYNFETTCGRVVPTAWLVASGFVSSEAIKNKIYMDTLGQSGSFTHAIADLIGGYVNTFGYDNFVLEWANKALHQNPKDIRCLLWKTNYKTIQAQKLIQEMGNPLPSKLKAYPKAWKKYQEVLQLYEQIDNLGHITVPDIIYQKWLESAQ